MFKELELIIELISITYCELPGTIFEGEVTAELSKITNYARLGNLHETLSEVFKPYGCQFYLNLEEINRIELPAAFAEGELNKKICYLR